MNKEYKEKYLKYKIKYLDKSLNNESQNTKNLKGGAEDNLDVLFFSKVGGSSTPGLSPPLNTHIDTGASTAPPAPQAPQAPQAEDSPPEEEAAPEEPAVVEEEEEAAPEAAPEEEDDPEEPAVVEEEEAAPEAAPEEEAAPAPEATPQAPATTATLKNLESLWKKFIESPNPVAQNILLTEITTDYNKVIVENNISLNTDLLNNIHYYFREQQKIDRILKLKGNKERRIIAIEQRIKNFQKYDIPPGLFITSGEIHRSSPPKTGVGASKTGADASSSSSSKVLELVGFIDNKMWPASTDLHAGLRLQRGDERFLFSFLHPLDPEGTLIHKIVKGGNETEDGNYSGIVSATPENTVERQATRDQLKNMKVVKDWLKS